MCRGLLQYFQKRRPVPGATRWKGRARSSRIAPATDAGRPQSQHEAQTIASSPHATIAHTTPDAGRTKSQEYSVKSDGCAFLHELMDPASKPRKPTLGRDFIRPKNRNMIPSRCELRQCFCSDSLHRSITFCWTEGWRIRALGRPNPFQLYGRRDQNAPLPAIGRDREVLRNCKGPGRQITV